MVKWKIDLAFASVILLFTRTLLHFLPESHENVVVKDSKKQGGLIGAGGGELVNVKIIKGFRVRNFSDGKAAIKYWYEPLLKLP